MTVSTEMKTETGFRTIEEVRAILAARGDRISRARVWQIERSALAKLARDPLLRALARDAGIELAPLEPPRRKGRRPKACSL
jgi:hypothetical protein